MLKREVNGKEKGVRIFRVNTVSQIYQIYLKFPMNEKFKVKGVVGGSIEPHAHPFNPPVKRSSFTIPLPVY